MKTFRRQSGQKELNKKLTIQKLATMPPASLFAEPIDYVFANHSRQRLLCQVLDEIAEVEAADRELVSAAYAFLTEEYAIHMLDEEGDLFPLLRRRADPEDDVNKVLGQIIDENMSDEGDAKDIVTLLGRLKGTTNMQKISKKDASLLKRFAANERNHLIVENAILLPLAKVRLSEDDQRKLGMRMAARRGTEMSKAAHD